MNNKLREIGYLTLAIITNQIGLLYVNTDANATANIFRKVKTTLGLNLDGVYGGALNTPLRVRFWTSSESPCL
ncbi:hypothetical protein [Anabaena sp. UHCC 0451]|uniref:hypothetical protein n=1 Tax=Anabaena sp. UHCC 0451 TaxID=2055235 RepID=UPI002B1F3B51|nr:hypothetical protein [Anabaena sp. UHCC 0451]MEA5576059.1 hypothetical protein [Anabaena sp. UHCC 0451]